MNNRHFASRTLLSSAVALGMVLSAGTALAKDPPANHEHPMQSESNEPVSDSWITTKVKADLLATKNVPGTEVKVETVNGVVTLSGTVDTQAERERAISVAKGIKGVHSVEAADLKVAAMKR